MCNALPQLIDAIDATGNTTPGFFNHISDALGQGFFDTWRENTRWTHFPGSGSTIAADFRTSWNQQHDAHAALSLTMSEEAPPPSILDCPIEGFGASIRKIQKSIMDDIQALNAKAVDRRMTALPLDDHRRKAWLAVTGNSFATQIMNGLPVPEVPITPTRWHVAASLYMGIPIKILNPYTGQTIDCGGAHNPTVDQHGHNLLSLNHARGGGISAHHNSLISRHPLPRAGKRAHESHGRQRRSQEYLPGGSRRRQPTGRQP